MPPRRRPGAGSDRIEAAVFGGPNVGGPPGTRTSWRFDRDRSTEEVDAVDGETEALALPQPRTRGERDECPVPVGNWNGSPRHRPRSAAPPVRSPSSGSFTPFAGFVAMSRSETASPRIDAKMRKTTSTVAGARTPVRPFTQARTSVGRIDAMARSAKNGRTWLRRWASTWATVLGRCTCAACQAAAYSPMVIRPAAGRGTSRRAAALDVREEPLGVDLALEVPGPLRAAGVQAVPGTPLAVGSSIDAGHVGLPVGALSRAGGTRGRPAGGPAPGSGSADEEPRSRLAMPCVSGRVPYLLVDPHLEVGSPVAHMAPHPEVPRPDAHPPPVRRACRLGSRARGDLVGREQRVQDARLEDDSIAHAPRSPRNRPSPREKLPNFPQGSCRRSTRPTHRDDHVLPRPTASACTLLQVPLREPAGTLSRSPSAVDILIIAIARSRRACCAGGRTVRGRRRRTTRPRTPSRGCRRGPTSTAS